MIVLTGSSGFIGGAVRSRLLNKNKQVIGFDYEKPADREFKTLHPDLFRSWWSSNWFNVQAVIHLGAVSDTMCTDTELVYSRNFWFSKMVWELCAEDNVPLVYASSAATYGDGAQGYSEQAVEELRPLNLYADSKHLFDKYALEAALKPDHWYGLKFFNVYGFDESRKGHMASMVYKAWRQVEEKGYINLFKGSYEFKRDFVYVENVVDVILFMLKKLPASGIYNVGSGQACSFHELAKYLCKALMINTNIRSIPMPDALKGKYQAYTCADIRKLRRAGFTKKFSTLETGIKKTIRQYENHPVALQS